MDKLYAPWRDRYVRSQIQGNVSKLCVFCELFASTELESDLFILFKNKDIVIILNLYPYNGGHLLVIPRIHVSELDELSDSTLHEIMIAISKSIKIVKEELGSQGVNFGANVGLAAGAGIPEHVHMHIVPRFVGDTGFFTTIGDAKQVSVDLDKIYKRLKPHFDKNF